ncbi:MAG: DNA repair protein RecO [Bacilli bacterium]|nr:DNA repair protein RecO [Bacilli bacterium]
MLETLEGIIINEKDYGETSKILTIITKEHGSISVISKGCKKVKSPLRSVSSKLIHGMFHLYYKEGKLSTLQNVDVINRYKNICMDLKSISYASLLLEVTLQVVKQNDDKNIYDILISSLNKMEEGYDAMVISDIALLKYLEYLGVMPVLDGCAKCGTTKSIATLSSDAGGYICNNCRINEPIVSDKAIKLVRMLYYVDIDKISKLDISEDVKKEIHSFIDRYYDRYTGLYFKTKKLLKVSE